MIKKVLRILFYPISLLGVFYFFRYVGILGFIGFIVGMFITAFLFLSKNPLLLGVVKMFEAEDYLKELEKK